MLRSKICRVISAITCLLSGVITVAVLVKLVSCALVGDSSVLPGESCLVDCVVRNCRRDAMVRIFTICGLVNFSLPYVISVRNTSLYGIRLSKVIASRFWWNGCAYVLYGILEIMGLYCASMDYLVSGAACFLGVIFSFISTGLLAVAFVIRQETLTVELIEQYLTIAPRRENKNRERNRLLQAGDYIQAYFSKNHAIPKVVVLGLLETLERAEECGLPERVEDYFLYIYSPVRSTAHNREARDVREDVRSGGGCDRSGELLDAVLMARAVCGRIFNGMEKFDQAELLRQLLHALSTDVQRENSSQRDVPDLSRVTSRDRKRSALFLCGLEAWRRQSLQTAHDSDARLNCWEALNNQILASDVYSVMDQHDQVCGNFRYMLCLLIILSGATALAEAVSLNQEIVEGTKEFWRQELKLLRRYDIILNDITDFFSWGQVILLASGDPRYNPEKCYMNIIQLRTMLTCIQKQI